jgi:hypothetical protein
MVFGAETDERFDWTQFNVLPVPKCTATGFIRDGIDLTAAQIGGAVTGTLDATDCNIGVYFDATHPGSVTDATIFGVELLRRRCQRRRPRRDRQHDQEHRRGPVQRRTARQCRCLPQRGERRHQRQHRL